MKITQESGYLIKKLFDINRPFHVGDIVSDNGSIGVTIAVNNEFYTCTVLWLYSSSIFELNIKTQYVSAASRKLSVIWTQGVVDNNV